MMRSIGGWQTLVWVVFAFICVFCVLIFLRKRRRWARMKARRDCLYGEDTRAGNSTSYGVFPNSDLPFHCGRVFLTGQNRPGHPWVMKMAPTGCASEFVKSDTWASLSEEFNRLASIPFVEVLVGRILRRCYPPLAPAFSLECRKRRAHQLSVFLELFVAENDLWQSSQSHAKKQGVRPVVFLGFDSCATLGYLDFFDRSLPIWDWQPMNLQERAVLLVSAGLGSNEEPYAIDMNDPIVFQLCQTACGPSFVYAVVAAFNQVARRVSSEELVRFGHRPFFAKLCQSVDHVATQWCMRDVPRVLVIGQSTRHSIGGITNLQSENAARFPGFSFTDLVSKMHDGPRRGSGAAGGCRLEVEFRLCLVFRDLGHLHRVPDEALGVSFEETLPKVDQLTTPFAIADVLACERSMESSSFCAPITPSVPSVPSESQVSPSFGKVQSAKTKWNHFLSWSWNTLKLGRFGGEGTGQSAPTVTLAFFMLLLFLDMLTCSVFWMRFLMNNSYGTLALWLALPPLMPLLPGFSGMAFVWTESSKVGLICASSALCSLINVLAVSLFLAGSWWLSSTKALPSTEMRLGILVVGLTILVKIGLHLSAHIRVEVTEVLDDRSRFDAEAKDEGSRMFPLGSFPRSHSLEPDFGSPTSAGGITGGGGSGTGGARFFDLSTIAARSAASSSSSRGRAVLGLAGRFVRGQGRGVELGGGSRSKGAETEMSHFSRRDPMEFGSVGSMSHCDSEDSPTARHAYVSSSADCPF